MVSNIFDFFYFGLYYVKNTMMSERYSLNRLIIYVPLGFS